MKKNLPQKNLPQKILFVCTGNICRSPTAEAVARHQAKEKNLEDNFIFDSAGIEAFHVGESPDQRSLMVGMQHGVSFADISSRKIRKNDFADFDLILAMDRSHFSRLLAESPQEYRGKVKLFLEFCAVKNSWNDEVIDPYYGNNQGFEEVFNVINLAVKNLLK